VTRVADIGVIGLGVMGRNLALNLADHGFVVACHDRDPSAIASLASLESHRPKFIGCPTLRELLAALRPPRIIIVLVPAGAPVDAVCRTLITDGVEPHDIVVDCGNSLFTDTSRRETEYRDKLIFFGSGISGGAAGARYGPSLMPGGDHHAWQRLRPIWEAIAAKVDPATGREIPKGVASSGAESCTAYIGPGGAGHYVKMVHNGIEYADMQLIAEAYDLLRSVVDMPPRNVSAVFREWNQGVLESYLIEITAELLERVHDESRMPLVDVILDAAEQKGTGAWSAINAMELGVPTPTIAEAVFARSMSALKSERVFASKLFPTPSTGGGERVRDVRAVIAAIRDALYCAKVCAYAQGFAQMAAASLEYRWDLDLSAIARIWRGGCIIRAQVLHTIARAFARDPALVNLLLDSHFVDEIARRQSDWRDVVAIAASAGIPTPAFSSSLGYFDSYRSERLPANLIQAQRDYFGGHGFARIDQPPGRVFHL
jgi:6-phosphogluconate dehydrogenase